MAAALRMSSISHNGELGEVRANEAQMAWRGSSGAILAVDLSSIKSAEWLNGSLSILHSDQEGLDHLLCLEGFRPEDHKALSGHLEQHAQVFMVGEAQEALPTLLSSSSRAAMQCEKDGEKPSKGQDSCAPDAEKQEIGTESQQEASRGFMVQRRIAADDEDEGLSCLFNEGFAPKAFDQRTHPYFFSSRNAAYGRSIFEGYVWKRSAWMKRWERRYLVLSTTGLFSYKARNEVTPSVVFEGVISCSASEDSFGRKGFCVVTRDGLLVQRHFIAAENDATRDQWVTKIKVGLLRQSA
jgi:hypothetical protein